MAVTVTFKVAVVVKLPSLTCNVKLAVLPAPQDARMSAVIVPAVLTMFETVTPFEGLALVIVTVRLPGDVSLSVTVAICELMAFEPF